MTLRSDSEPSHHRSYQAATSSASAATSWPPASTCCCAHCALSRAVSITVGTGTPSAASCWATVLAPSTVDCAQDRVSACRSRLRASVRSFAGVASTGATVAAQNDE